MRDFSRYILIAEMRFLFWSFLKNTLRGGTLWNCDFFYSANWFLHSQSFYLREAFVNWKSITSIRRMPKHLNCLQFPSQFVIFEFVCWNDLWSRRIAMGWNKRTSVTVVVYLSHGTLIFKLARDLRVGEIVTTTLPVPAGTGRDPPMRLPLRTTRYITATWHHWVMTDGSETALHSKTTVLTTRCNPLTERTQIKEYAGRT